MRREKKPCLFVLMLFVSGNGNKKSNLYYMFTWDSRFKILILWQVEKLQKRNFMHLWKN